jgi:hypothetical protein
MGANVGTLPLPQRKATPRKVWIASMLVALTVAVGVATSLALRGNDIKGTGAPQVQNAGQAEQSYQSGLQARQGWILPAIVQYRTRGSAADASALTSAGARLREIAGRRNLGSAAPNTSSASRTNPDLCPFGKRGPC